jgi:tape measure domain-containing protein
VAIELATGYVSVVPSAQGFTQKLRQEISAPLAQMGNQMGRELSGSLTGAVGGAVRAGGRMLTDGLAAAGRAGMHALEGAAAVTGGVIATSLVKGFGRLTAIDDARGKLQGLGHDAQAIETIMESALDAVRGTAYGLGEAATLAATAVAAGIDPGEELTDYLSLVADTATIAGGSLSEIGSIINKTTALGRVYTMELRQLADRGLPVFQWLAEEYGVSQDALADMVSEGQVDAETFRRVIEENIGGAALASGETFRGGLANVGAAMGRFGEAVLKPFFELARDVAFPQLIEFFGQLTERAGDFFGSVGDSPMFWRFAAWLQELPGHLSNVLPKLRDLGPALAPLAAFVGALSLRGMSSMLGPLGAIVPTISPILAAFVAFVATNDDLRDAFGRLGQALLDVGARIGEALAPVAERFLPLFVDGLSTVVNVLADAIPVIADFVEDALGALSRWWTDNGDTIIGFFEGLGAAVKVAFEEILAPAAEAVATELGKVLPHLSWFIENEAPLIGMLTALAVVVGTKLAIAVWGYATAMTAAAIATVVAMAPWILAAAIIAILAAAVYWAYENWGWFKEGVDNIIPSIQNADEVIRNLWRGVKDLIDRLKEAWEWLEKVTNPTGSARDIVSPKSWFDDTFGWITGNAQGTSYWPGGWSWVGEEGPELVNLSPGTAVYDATVSAALTAPGGGSDAPLIAGDFVVQRLPGEDEGMTTFHQLRKLKMVMG